MLLGEAFWQIARYWRAVEGGKGSLRAIVLEAVQEGDRESNIWTLDEAARGMYHIRHE